MNTLALLLAASISAPNVDTIREVLAIGPVVRGGRVPFPIDPIQKTIVDGTWIVPKDGDSIDLGDGKKATWQKAVAGDDGRFSGQGFSGGYAYAAYEAAADGFAILRAPGSGTVYVNGVPRAGDPYGYGYLRLPIELKKGKNDLLFATSRGGLQVEIETFIQPIELSLEDATLPDAIVGEDQPLWASLTLHNALPMRLGKVVVRCSIEGQKAIETPQPAVTPMTRFKTRFAIPGKFDKPGEQEVKVELLVDDRTVDVKTFKLAAKEATDLHKRTFISDIDGSVQYYAVLPAKPAEPLGKPPALILSLHGASVEAPSQAAAYGQKSWCLIVCPTNRRPYGFDWEDWGRMDAMEALADAQKRYRYDPQAVYLTGHSMGGHGTWHLGVTFPDKFAAIGPSAGWSSFFSYAGGNWNEEAGDIERMFQRAQNPSRTLDLVGNLNGQAVYVLHGDADDNVPVSEARTMVKALEATHKDFLVHEEPKAGHWWDNSDEPGAACVDWPAMFDLFARRKLPSIKEVRKVQFATANVANSNACHWARIEQQEKWGEISRIDLTVDPLTRKFKGTTTNVAVLALRLRDVVAPGDAVTVELDGKTVTSDKLAENMLWLAKSADGWKIVNGISGKSPLRSGPFKHAFGRKAILVYGTTGTDEENLWSYATARFQAETWGYRANGSFEVVSDKEFDINGTQGRSVILYGNADSNAIWSTLLKGVPINARRGEFGFNRESFKGDDLAFAFAVPRPGLGQPLIGCIGGTGMKGMRLVTRAPFFLSGVAFPDLAVWRTSVLERGFEGVEAAGYFGSDWSVEKGDWAIKK
ncbi:MAG: hypothetical protein HONBIEJF_01840 [Fimbriimonadaceae bacterium]|nr:hypothetical protein [Fimbriimonadaceae bacterium]